jgi:hypothetical protein
MRPAHEADHRDMSRTATKRRPESCPAHPPPDRSLNPCGSTRQHAEGLH